MTREAARLRWSPSATPRHVGALALLVGVVALAVPSRPFGERPTWEALLAPYATGAPLPGGFRVEEIRRGAENDVVIRVRRPDDGAAVEVVVVERGRWKSSHESPSFTIDYELPRSPAAERDAVTALLAQTIRSRDRGLPSPDAIPLRAVDPSVLPWPLEMLRGVRGMLFGASVVLLALIALHGSPALAWLGVGLGATDVIVRVAGVPALRPDVGAVWSLPAAAVLLVLGLRGRGSRRGTWLVAASIVAALAIVLRLALGPWGPLHVNGHGPRFVAGAVGDAADIAAYGPGYRELFAPVAALAPASPDWAIFACNAILSALLAPLAFALGRLTGLAANAALLAALLLAIDPVGIRMGATEAYFPAIAFLCASASVVMLLAVREDDAGDRWRAGALLVAAGLLLAQAARIHPCAWVVMATTPFVVVAGDVGRWPRRLVMGVGAAAVGGGVLSFTSASTLLEVLGKIRTGTVLRPRPPSLEPLVWLATAAAVYAVLAPRRRFAVPAAIALAAMAVTRQAFDASAMWEQSYYRLYLTLPLVAVIACVPPAWLRRREVAVAGAVVLVVVWFRLAWPIVAGRSPEHLEYRWVREQLLRIPPECRVVHVALAGTRVLTLPTYAGGGRSAVAIDLRRPQTLEAALAPAPCLYYVRTSLCSTADGRPDCDAVERRLTLVPVARASFAAAGPFETFSHDRDAFETAIARVDGR